MSTSNSSSHAFRTSEVRHGGFLLIEVVMAMGILVLVSVGMYKIMAVAIQTTTELRSSKHRIQEVNGLIELCRRTISKLPNTATITSKVTQDGGNYFPELVITNAPQALSFGPASAHYGPKSLAVRQQIGGLHTLSIFFEAEENSNQLSIGTDDTLPPPILLLGDIRSVEWMFYDSRSTSWLEKWEQTGNRPQLIRLTLTVAETSDPYVATFWVPPAGPAPQTGGDQPQQPQGGGSTPSPAPSPSPPTLPTP